MVFEVIDFIIKLVINNNVKPFESKSISSSINYRNQLRQMSRILLILKKDSSGDEKIYYGVP